jgi:hypothetical protein
MTSRGKRGRKIVVRVLAFAAGSIVALLVLLAPLGVPMVRPDIAVADDMGGGGGGGGGGDNGSSCSCVNGHCTGNCPTTTKPTSPPTTPKPNAPAPSSPATTAGNRSTVTTRSSGQSTHKPAAQDFAPGDAVATPAVVPTANVAIDPLATTGLPAPVVAQSAATGGGDTNNGWAVGAGVAITAAGIALGATALRPGGTSPAAATNAGSYGDYGDYVDPGGSGPASGGGSAQ